MRLLSVIPKGPAPIVCLGCATLGLAVAANALFLQSARHPAPLLFTRALSGQAPAVRDPLIQAVQTALKGGLRYTGPIDGVLGPQTKAAIADFQRLAGRAPTGVPTRDLPDLITAKLGSHPQPMAKPAAIAQDASDISRTAAVQEALARAAYGQLRADGVFGPQTAQAIRRFQADHNLPVTGEIDDRLMVALRAVGAMAAR
jgi:peptidoglycan hydrolase-like protein with peptidoglycan-binding domain